LNEMEVRPVEKAREVVKKGRENIKDRVNAAFALVEELVTDARKALKESREGVRSVAASGVSLATDIVDSSLKFAREQVEIARRWLKSR